MKAGYLISPEFHRNLWQKFSPFRLAVPPAVFFVIMAVANARGGEQGKNLVLGAITMGYIFLTIIGGTYSAAFSMQEEIRGNTWDFQRMSALSPAQLAFGKLFGAVSYALYCGIFIALLYFSAFPPEKPVIFAAVFAVLGALTAYAAAFFITLALVPVHASFGRHASGGGIAAFLVGCITGFFLLSEFVDDALRAHEYAGYSWARDRFVDVVWWGQPYDGYAFAATGMALFLAWFLAGCCRLVKAELMYRVTPVVWTAFVGFVLAWVSGFAFGAEKATLFTAPSFVDGSTRSFLYIPPLLLAAKWSFFISAAICCLATTVEAGDIRKYNRCIEAWRRGDRRALLWNLPRWAAIMPYPLLALGLAVFASFAAPGENTTSLAVFMAGAMFFLLRDALVLHALVRRLKRRAPFTFLVYLGFAYFLLPWLAMEIAGGGRGEWSFGWQFDRMMGAFGNDHYRFPLDPVFGVFFPTGGTWATLVLPIVQALFAGLFLLWVARTSRFGVQPPAAGDRGA